MRVYLYPTPLHYRQIPELVQGAGATVLIGADTFLTGYARFASAFDFRSLRYVIAGAEPVKAETRRVYMEKFGLPILEGYGVTECSPVLAVNTAVFNRNGTVGKLLPNIEARLEPVPGIEEGGRLRVRGPNVMIGYYRADDPGELEPPPGGWHDTGDIVMIDAEGFLAVKGRAKRFAKIAGETVSLGAVEDILSGLWPDDLVAAVTAPDPKKGERVDPRHDQGRGDQGGGADLDEDQGRLRTHVPGIGRRARGDPAARQRQDRLYRADEGAAGTGGVRTALQPRWAVSPPGLQPSGLRRGTPHLGRERLISTR